MNLESDLEYYVEHPDRLLDLCREVLERLDTGTGGEAAKQLQAVSAAIEQLQRQGIPVPDGLRSEKLRLAGEQARSEDATRNLRSFVDGLEQLIMPYSIKAPKMHGAATGTRVRRNGGNAAETTEKQTFHRLIIEILRSCGGRAKTSDVLDEIERQMQGRFLPRDLEVRTDGTLVWKNRAQWERLNMVKDGILRNDSRHGVWELSDQYK